MIQQSFDRFNLPVGEHVEPIIDINHVWVVTSARYKDLVAEQLTGINPQHILLEPCMRNTAPCVAYVSWKIQKEDPDALIVVAPSDHLVLNVPAFQETIRKGLDSEYQGNLIYLLEMTTSFIRANTATRWYKLPTHRMNIPEYSDRAILEAVVNHLIHRDYIVMGSELHVDAEPRLTPLMLVIILDLYFRLTPNTMVEDTPEVAELARLVGIGPSLVVDVLRSFLCCDPYLNYVPEMDNKLVGPCSRIWNEYAILEPQELEGLAEQMKYYFK